MKTAQRHSPYPLSHRFEPDRLFLVIYRLILPVGYASQVPISRSFERPKLLILFFFVSRQRLRFSELEILGLAARM